MSNQTDDSVYLRIRNAKKTVVLELKSNQIVNDVKQEIAEVLELNNKEFVKIYRETEPLDDVKSLKNCNITPETAKPHAGVCGNSQNRAIHGFWPFWTSFGAF